MWRCLVLAWLCGFCSSFVLISSAAAGQDFNVFQVGRKWVYQLHSTVLLNEVQGGGKNVGFFITGDVAVHAVFQAGDEKILKFELRGLQLHVRSRRAPKSDGFMKHSSKLERFEVEPFYVQWTKGKIDKVYLPNNEDISLSNLKKGIASLFQFQVTNVERTETDSFGTCTTSYQTMDLFTFQKTKSDCVSSDLPFTKSTDSVLGVETKSHRQVLYELDDSLTQIKHIYAKELHRMVLAVREGLGSVVEAEQVLNFVKSEKTTVEDSILDLLEGFNVEDLTTKREIVANEQTLTSVVNELRENLATKNLGNLVSAKSFLRVLEVARRAPKEEVTKVLANKKNQNILPQLYDILGFVQTPEAHASVLKNLHFDREDHLDLSERYLWALSLSHHPHPDILKDLLDRYRKNEYPDKVKETLILTIASMARSSSNTKLVQSVEETIINNLNFAKNDTRFVFLRALKNLQSPKTVPLLLQILKTGSNKEGVLALKALKTLSDPYSLFKTLRSVFLQLDRRYDSSARTLAIDMLLETPPKEPFLKVILNYLKSNESNSEVKQYVMQRLKMLSDEDWSFNEKLSKLIRADPSLNNYEVLSSKGLSLALKRPIGNNGTLGTVQEMFGGIVKRGVVDVVMNKGNAKEMFSLGIFAGGLSSFLGAEVEGDEETATAGMDLTIMGTQIRPFVFFNGQGELMGHVWAGTASERTTAFQSLVLLQDHLQYVRLGNGFIAEMSVRGGMSFDLAGNIEISIWSRTANSLVQKSAGIVSNGLIVVDSSFVKSQVEFVASIEPKLDIQSDTDFSGDISFCIRVTQPDCVFRYNVFKVERIPESKHKLRIAKYKKTLIPGVTYSLNRKNDEMCSAMLT